MSSSAPEPPRQPYPAMPAYSMGASPPEPDATPPPAPAEVAPGQAPALPGRVGAPYPLPGSPYPLPGSPYPAGMVPAPPPGPGVTPPFPAPPVEGRSTRLWVGLGVAGLAVVLCCGGGLAAGIGLVVTGVEAVKEQGAAVVGEYLDDVQAGRYAEAYDALCPSLRALESERQFANRIADEPKIAQYDVGEVQVTPMIAVPVTVRYAGGGGDTLRFELSQDSDSGQLEVCGIDG